MFRAFCLAFCFTTILIVFIIEAAPSNSVIISNSDLNLPVCYIRTEEGKILDLGNLCREPTRNIINPTNQAVDVKRLLDTKDCSGCNLSGANFANSKLTFVNLTNANLSGANLSGAILIGANLSNANLTNTNLNGAKLNGAKLIGTNLNGTNLGGANLLGANLWGTNLNGAKLNSTKMPDGTLHN
jgi:uncharacterized protein YjbI with pentapeptide repeats